MYFYSRIVIILLMSFWLVSIDRETLGDGIDALNSLTFMKYILAVCLIPEAKAVFYYIKPYVE